MIGGLEFQLQHEPVVHTWGVDPSNAQGMNLYNRELMAGRQTIFSEVVFSSKSR